MINQPTQNSKKHSLVRKINPSYISLTSTSLKHMLFTFLFFSHCVELVFDKFHNYVFQLLRAFGYIWW